MSRLNFKSILAIGTHSDDIEFGCFGLLLKESKKLTKITSIIVSPDSTNTDGMSEIRRHETEEALSAISNNNILVMENDRITEKDYPKVADYIRDIIIKNNIDLLVVHYPDDTNQEHRLLSEIAVTAARRLPISIFYYESPSSGKSFIPDLYVDISEEYDQKRSALKKHKTQQEKPFMQNYYLESFNVSSQARLLGITYVEKFSILRFIER